MPAVAAASARRLDVPAHSATETPLSRPHGSWRPSRRFRLYGNWGAAISTAEVEVATVSSWASDTRAANEKVAIHAAHPRSFLELAAEYERIGRPTTRVNVPLTFDPDDYPVV